MPAIVLEKIPANLELRLKTQASRNRRSPTQEVVAILDHALPEIPPVRLPDPIKPLKKISANMILQGIHEGRE